MIATWPCPGPDPGTASEYALVLEGAGEARVLIVPALFDEGNRLRRYTVETMRALQRLRIGSVVIDLPGSNESLTPLSCVSREDWTRAVAAAVAHFGATHALAIRGGALVCGGAGVPLLTYAPVAGAAILRQMVRMRVLSAREAGREEKAAELMAEGRTQGIVLAGYALGPALVRGLEGAEPCDGRTIAQADIGGPGLWLRAEAGEDAGQSAALAGLVAEECRS